jgi:hypothetical protein
MNKKILIASIFATLMLLIPISSAVDVNTDVDDEALMNFGVKPLDADTEIITRIHGYSDNYETHSWKGLIRNISIWGSETLELKIEGWKYPFLTYFFKTVTVVHASFFIGYFSFNRHVGEWFVNGIAIGNIERM